AKTTRRGNQELGTGPCERDAEVPMQSAMKHRGGRARLLCVSSRRRWSKLSRLGSAHPPQNCVGNDGGVCRAFSIRRQLRSPAACKSRQVGYVRRFLLP